MYLYFLALPQKVPKPALPVCRQARRQAGTLGKSNWLPIRFLFPSSVEVSDQ